MQALLNPYLIMKCGEIMTYKFEFSKKFQKDISKLDNQTQKQIKYTIDKFIINPFSCDWIKLKGFDNYYRIRSGDYRIIFEKIEETNTIIIKFLKANHRREVYKDL